MKILILSFFLVLCSLLYSQGNLQFNQVLTFTGQFTGIGCGSAQIGAVPSGKVWKIEFVGGQRSSGTGWDDGIIVNGVNVNIGINSSSKTFPIWLKADDILSFFSCGPSNGNPIPQTTSRYLISILEFNIIP